MKPIVLTLTTLLLCCSSPKQKEKVRTTTIIKSSCDKLLSMCTELTPLMIEGLVNRRCGSWYSSHCDVNHRRDIRIYGIKSTDCQNILCSIKLPYMEEACKDYRKLILEYQPRTPVMQALNRQTQPLSTKYFELNCDTLLQNTLTR